MSKAREPIGANPSGVEDPNIYDRFVLFCIIDMMI
jgi:hypothetical protein